MDAWPSFDEFDGGDHTAARDDSVLIIACGALAREIKALIDGNGFSNVTLKCLPATLHNRPEAIPDAVRNAIRKARGHFDTIAVAYADCGTGGRLDAVLAEEGVERLPGAHCYAFFSGIEAFEARADEDMRALFLTDFLARHFDTLLVRPLGLDRHPELRDLYFGNYEKVVYLAQTDDDDLTEKARKAAEALGLAFERRMTGFGALSPFVTGLVRTPEITI